MCLGVDSVMDQMRFAHQELHRRVHFADINRCPPWLIIFLSVDHVEIINIISVGIFDRPSGAARPSTRTSTATPGGPKRMALRRTFSIALEIRALSPLTWVVSPSNSRTDFLSGAPSRRASSTVSSNSAWRSNSSVLSWGLA